MGSLAQLAAKGDEFLNDPLLTAASIMLVSVGVLWILFSRLISYNLKRAALRRNRFEAQVRGGMTIEEIREAERKRRHRLQRKLQ